MEASLWIMLQQDEPGCEPGFAHFGWRGVLQFLEDRVEGGLPSGEEFGGDGSVALTESLLDLSDKVESPGGQAPVGKVSDLGVGEGLPGRGHFVPPS